MKVQDGRWRINSRDIWRSTECDHCLRLSMAVAAGVPEAVAKVQPYKVDLSNKLPILQGTDFEAMLFEQLAANLGSQFVELPPFSNQDDTALALAENPIVLAQVYLAKDFESFFITGYADLLVREDHQLVLDANGNLGVEASGFEGNKYTVWDVKHSSKAKPHYLLQVGSYLDALSDLGMASDRPSGILLRDRSFDAHNPNDLVGGYLMARDEFYRVLASTPPSQVVSADGLSWQCVTPSTCGVIFCEYPDLCEADRVEKDDLSQLYRLHASHTQKLKDAGFATVAAIANWVGEAPAGVIKAEQFERIRIWAQLIERQKQEGAPCMALLQSPSQIRAELPKPHPADLFFDLEWYTNVGESRELHYVFGVVGRDQEFIKFEARDFEQEKIAFRNFMAFAAKHIAQNPGAHIYHYNNPETLHLTKLAKDHGELHTQVAQLFEHMVDLLPLVRASMVNGFGALGIKTLEHFYSTGVHDADGLRGDTDVADGLDSQVKFYGYLKAVQAGDLAGAEAIFDSILSYNKADCVSTVLLLDWLHGGLDQYQVISTTQGD